MIPSTLLAEMAVSRKNWREIAVAGRTYVWLVNGADEGINVVVATEATFVSGQSSQQLRFRLEHGQVAVTPGVVRLAIELAMAAHPPFTGDIGAPNITLSAETLAAVQARAHPGAVNFGKVVAGPGAAPPGASCLRGAFDEVACEILSLCEQLAERVGAPGLEDPRDFVKHGEFGLAIDTLADRCLSGEPPVTITFEELNRFAALAESMGIRKIWVDLLACLSPVERARLPQDLRLLALAYLEMETHANPARAQWLENLRQLLSV